MQDQEIQIMHQQFNELFRELDLPSKKWLYEIIKELQRAKKMHPSWPKDAIYAAGIVGEESGELLRAALQHTEKSDNLEAIREEAIQTGAMCLRLLVESPLMRFANWES